MDSNSVVVITGANSGMGKASSAALARTGAKVLMLCRNRERGAAAVNEIRELVGGDNAELVICDLASRDSIRKAASEIRTKYSRIDILLNNAGVNLPGYSRTEDGVEMHFGVNHLGHFLLTMELLPLLKAGAPSRIINVASGVHKIGEIDFDDINMERNFRPMKAYSRSKLANVLFTYELAERLEGAGVTVNCLHPGVVATSIVVNRETGSGTLISKLMKLIFMSPERGADTAVYLALSEDVEGCTGKYFYKRKAVRSSQSSYDKELAQQLWAVSEEMAGISMYSRDGE